MKTKKIITKQEKEYTYFCEICKEEIKHNHGWEHHNCECYADIGEWYPESRSGTKWTFDICATCFIENVIPALKRELGLEPRKKEYSY